MKKVFENFREMGRAYLRRITALARKIEYAVKASGENILMDN